MLPVLLEWKILKIWQQEAEITMLKAKVEELEAKADDGQVHPENLESKPISKLLVSMFSDDAATETDLHSDLISIHVHFHKIWTLIMRFCNDETFLNELSDLGSGKEAQLVQRSLGLLVEPVISSGLRQDGSEAEDTCGSYWDRSGRHGYNSEGEVVSVWFCWG